MLGSCLVIVSDQEPTTIDATGYIWLVPTNLPWWHGTKEWEFPPWTYTPAALKPAATVVHGGWVRRLRGRRRTIFCFRKAVRDGSTSRSQHCLTVWKFDHHGPWSTNHGPLSFVNDHNQPWQTLTYPNESGYSGSRFALSILPWNRSPFQQFQRLVAVGSVWNSWNVFFPLLGAHS